MSEKKFDILKNAKDDIIEELIPFSSDDEQTKKRAKRLLVCYAQRMV